MLSGFERAMLPSIGLIVVYNYCRNNICNRHFGHTNICTVSTRLDKMDGITINAYVQLYIFTLSWYEILMPLCAFWNMI